MIVKINHLKKIKTILPLLASQRFRDEIVLVVSNEKLLFSLNILKNHIGYCYKLLTSVSGVDLLGKSYRFSVVFDLLSLTYSSRLRLKVFVNEIKPVFSSVDIFVNANWWEREIWDLFGILFLNHPDLRRLLTDYGFEGYPLRKEFPLPGYVEVRYDHFQKRVLCEPNHIITQEFRVFNFSSPWKSTSV
jgi:NADH dehydrogenase (ubiquinone) Fe-S protein 3